MSHLDDAPGPPPLRRRLARGIDRLHARLAGRWPARGALLAAPEPWDVGSPEHGRRLLDGAFRLAGHPVRTRGRSIWDVAPPLAAPAEGAAAQGGAQGRAQGGAQGAALGSVPGPDPAFEAARHGFGWLPDLAAEGSDEAAALARGWTLAWVDRFGRGAGPGWTPALAGRRARLWLDHAGFVFGPGAPPPEARRALERGALFLRRRWRSAPPGPERIEALAGLIRAALALDGLAPSAHAAARALAEAGAWIDAGGAIPSRSPEALLDVVALLAESAAALREAGAEPPEALRAAVERGGSALRALRHADGGLARFHGGGRGAPGRLDRALAEGGARPRRGPAPPLVMGFARLRAGRTSVLVDAAPPPLGLGSRAAHASTLALEVTVGRRPLLVSCGPGAAFGPAWRRAGRATASHSTLDLEGLSSSRAAPGGGPDAALVEGPREVRRERYGGPEGLSLKVSHDGWRETHGLTHARELDLSPDGGELRGEDTLAALTEADHARFEAALARPEGLGGIQWRLRFHLHPDVEPRSIRGGAVTLALPSGETWVFGHDGAAELGLLPSVYLDPGRPRPARADQIVLTMRKAEPVSRVRWRLAREGAARRDHGPPAEPGWGPGDEDEG